MLVYVLGTSDRFLKPDRKVTMKKQAIRSFLVILVLVIGIGTSVAMTVPKVTEADLNLLISALGQKESSNDDNAVGDTNKVYWAYGYLQVRQPFVDDVNAKWHTNIRAKDLRGDRTKSIWVVKEFFKIHVTRARLGREPTLQDYARVLNGGPKGWQRSCTKGYWVDVERIMKKLKSKMKQKS